jgi:general L-amino acid transport system substrate-binding protein
VLLAAAGCDRREKAAPPAAAPAPAEGPAAAPGAGETLRAVRARGQLNCGVHPGLIGFAARDARGVWRGFDADFCRAVSAAVFGSTERVNFVPLGLEERFEAVRSGQVDVLARNTSQTFTRDVEFALDFPAISYFDAQGFLVRRSLNLTSAAELGGARVCVQSGSTSALNLADFIRSRGVDIEVVALTGDEEARNAYGREECDGYTADISNLASARAVLSDPGAHVILPDVISKEPLAPAVRQGDPQWADLVRWTLNVLILAEELGVTSANVEALSGTSEDPEVRRLLGAEGNYGGMLGIEQAWAVSVIKAVGNYAEVFERNVGRDSPLELERGLNAQWTADPPGLLYAPPLR